MDLDRRTFFKLAGLAAVGFAGKEIGEAVASEQLVSTPGLKRLAMVIDLTKCQAKNGCNICITNCHSVHNVPEMPDSRHSVRWIWQEQYHQLFPTEEHPFVRADLKNVPMVAMCNHCDNPPCVRVCPTKATFRRETDGVVMFDPHRCLGCRYCVAACPYGARSFNWKNPRPHIKKIDPKFPPRDRGVVEKCNFCSERLSEGLDPKCVEVCPHKALSFGDLKDPRSSVIELLQKDYTIRRKPGLGTNPQVYYIV